MKIEIHGVSKGFGSQKLFKNLSFAFETWGIQGIVGQNGTGKTTLLKMLAGLETYHGRISLTNDEALPMVQKDITYVSPHPYMLDMAVEDNILYPLKVRKWDRAHMQARADELIQLFDIDHLRHKKATRLSAGETQKVALARALSFRPRLLLLDEPTANIDAESTREIEMVIKAFQEQESSIVIAVTHNHMQAERFCHHIYELKDGLLLKRPPAAQGGY